MSHSKLIYSTPASAPISFTLYDTAIPSFQDLDHLISKTQTLLNSPTCGINDLEIQLETLNQCQQILAKHKTKKNFIHVGMGGSILGAEVLIEALAQNTTSSNTIFLNNLDADSLHEKLDALDLLQSVVFVVTKSGNTLETHIIMQILFSKFKNIPELKNVSDEKIYQNHFIFATDPKVGIIRKMCDQYQISSLEIPSKLGGRFCALSSVGFLPAQFNKLDTHKILTGAVKTRNFFLINDKTNSIFKLAWIILQHYSKGLDQTVLMPYSSKLKAFNSWFAQLWSESLGKINNTQQNVGPTPVVAYGPADQHSQLQLFMQGPNNKYFMFLKILKNNNDIELKNNPTFLSDIDNKYLSEIVHAQLVGTMSALQSNLRPFVALEIEKLNEENLGCLIYFFELFTIIVGAGLSVDPFNQPGVELGKNLTWNYLRDGKSPLLK